MKVGQNSSIVRWVAKLVAKERQAKASQAAARVQTLDIEQLRHVSGGTSNATDGPNKGW